MRRWWKQQHSASVTTQLHGDDHRDRRHQLDDCGDRAVVG
jgi:hypothetical protein